MSVQYRDRPSQAEQRCHSNSDRVSIGLQTGRLGCVYADAQCICLCVCQSAFSIILRVSRNGFVSAQRRIFCEGIWQGGEKPFIAIEML